MVAVHTLWHLGKHVLVQEEGAKAVSREKETGSRAWEMLFQILALLCDLIQIT